MDRSLFKALRRAGMALAVACAAFTATASQATTERMDYTLESLTSGDSIAIDGGNVSFSNFSVKISGLGSEDFSDYEVVARADGFELKGKKEGGFESLRLELSYDVTLDEDYKFAAITIESSKLDGANGMALKASDSGGDVALASWNRYFKRSQRYAGNASSAGSTLSVLETIVIAHGDSSENWSSTREFENSLDSDASVPEPTTALMLAMGLVGLASYSRRAAA
jgi:hypothetical protein